MVSFIQALAIDHHCIDICQIHHPTLDDL